MNKLRIAIIGTGRIAETHARAFQELGNAEVVAACSRTPERLHAFANRFGIPSAFTDAGELIDNPEVDAVVVATPNHTHAPLTIAALGAGKHVLCEKPMAMNATEAREMLDASRASDKLLMIGMCRRFAPTTQLVRDLVSDGRLGDVYYAKTGYIRRWGNPGGWFSQQHLAGGGPVIDLGVHVLDLLRYTTGHPTVVSVSAATFSSIGARPGVKGLSKYSAVDETVGEDMNDVEDGAAAFIRFDSGLALAFEVSWVQNIGQDRLYLELYGDRAGLDLSGSEGYLGVRLHGSLGDYLADTSPVLGPDAQLAGNNFVRQAENFVEAAMGEATCLSPAEDGVAISKLVDAIYESARLGREVRIG